MYALPLRYKREALAVHDNSLQTDSSSRELSLSREGNSTQVDVGYYAPAARTTLNLAVFIEFLSEIELRLANPRVHTLWARAGAFRHPAVVCSTTTPVGGSNRDKRPPFCPGWCLQPGQKAPVPLLARLAVGSGTKATYCPRPKGCRDKWPGIKTYSVVVI